ncbi:MAG: hypothetical protein Q9191_003405 [Dirinaria sp. TL-2023a]
MSLLNINRAQNPSRSNLLAIPLEIRKEIYELCLCVDGDLVPYPEPFETEYETDCKGQKPTVALLAVSRQIRVETLLILFAKNSWRITFAPARLSIPDIVDQVYPNTRRTFWGWFGHLMRHIVCRYSYRNVDAKVSTRDRKKIFSTVRGELDEDQTSVMHQMDYENMQIGWISMGLSVAKLPNLKTLALHIDELFCPEGCCRIGPVTSFFPYYMLPLDAKVEIYGIRPGAQSRYEAKRIREAILNRLRTWEKNAAEVNYKIHVPSEGEGTKAYSLDEVAEFAETEEAQET